MATWDSGSGLNQSKVVCVGKAFVGAKKSMRVLARIFEREAEGCRSDAKPKVESKTSFEKA